MGDGVLRVVAFLIRSLSDHWQGVPRPVPLCQTSDTQLAYLLSLSLTIGISPI
jgi:hypothetical protein